MTHDTRSPLPIQSGVSPDQIVLPAPVTRQFVRPLTVPDANALVFSDTHIPHHSTLMLQRAIYITLRYFPHIRRFVMAGDSWDFSSISRHPKDQPYEDLDDVLEKGAEVYRAIGDYFDEGYITNGNHDARIGLKLDAPFTLKRVFNSAFGDHWPACKLHITNLDWVHMDSADGDPSKKWTIGHPSNYSGSAGRMPSEIADLEQRNVATGHNHLVGMAQSKSGNYLGIDIGHMTDPSSHYYVVRRLQKFSRWNAGFLIISNGRPYPYWERWTDWNALGCL